MIGCDLVFSQYWNSQEKKFFTILKSPVETSLERLQQKAIFNIVNDTLPHLDKYFVTLTVDDEHYDEVFRKQAASFYMRAFLTKLRNWLKHDNFSFEYIWRLERGGRSSQRYHFHLILASNCSLLDIADYIQSRWHVCQWDKINRERSFQELSSANLSAIYVSKYCAKPNAHPKKGDFHESPAKVRDECKSRIWSTSRGFVRIPHHLRMKFNWDIKTWQNAVKSNWYPLGDELFDDSLFMHWQNLGEVPLEHASQAVRDSYDKYISLETIKRSQWAGQTFYNKYPFEKICIHSFKNETLKPESFPKNFKEFFEKNPNLHKEELDLSELSDRYSYIAKNFYKEIQPEKHWEYQNTARSKVTTREYEVAVPSRKWKGETIYKRTKRISVEFSQE